MCALAVEAGARRTPVAAAAGGPAAPGGRDPGQRGCIAAARRRRSATSHAEVARLTAELAIDATPIRPTTRTTEAIGFDEIIGESAGAQGGAGTREGSRADALHGAAARRDRDRQGADRARAASPGTAADLPLVSVNCAALPPTLIESELFGHERGAFTGAVAMRPGRFQLAHHGTLVPRRDRRSAARPAKQAAPRPAGRRVRADRIVAHPEGGRADRRGDAQGSGARRRRRRVPRRSVLPAERVSDSPAVAARATRGHSGAGLVHHSEAAARACTTGSRVCPTRVMDALQNHSWPGNVRELENVIERALDSLAGHTLRLLDDALETPASRAPAEDANTLSAVERTHIEERAARLPLADQRRRQRRRATRPASQHPALPHEETRHRQERRRGPAGRGHDAGS